MTQTPGPARHQVIVVGAGSAGQRMASELLADGLSDFLVLDHASGSEVISSVFDDGTDTWTLRTADGQMHRSDVVIASHQVALPWTPKFNGDNDFRGAAFPAAQWDHGFDPAGKHIAVIGSDATSGHYLGQLVASAASVSVFVHAPRRVVPRVPLLATLPTSPAMEWLRRGRQARTGQAPKAPALVRSAIDALTATGIRTSDGVDHYADAVIYGTGFATPEAVLVGSRGLSIQQVWNDGMEPYLGIAVHGFPNFFLISGPDFGVQARYIADCVALMKRNGSTRIEVRRSTQQVFNERVYLEPAAQHPPAQAFDVWAGPSDKDKAFDGAATLTVVGTPHQVRVRLTGHLDPIDGQYHWQGTVFNPSAKPLPDDVLKRARTATLTVGDRSASARVVEQTPWGTHSVAGVGAPPFEIRDAEAPDKPT